MGAPVGLLSVACTRSRGEVGKEKDEDQETKVQMEKQCQEKGKETPNGLELKEFISMANLTRRVEILVLLPFFCFVTVPR